MDSLRGVGVEKLEQPDVQGSEIERWCGEQIGGGNIRDQGNRLIDQSDELPASDRECAA